MNCSKTLSLVQIDEIFEEFDVNGDGHLSVAEFSTLMGMDEGGEKMKEEKVSELDDDASEETEVEDTSCIYDEAS